MGNMSASSAHKMGVVALTLVTASNMMGSGVFMLPTNLILWAELALMFPIMLFL